MTAPNAYRGISPYVPQLDEATRRDATCACGAVFSQARIDETWMDALAVHHRRAAVLIASHHPDLYTPRRCPKCERAQIRLDANLSMPQSIRPDHPDHGDTAL